MIDSSILSLLVLIVLAVLLVLSDRGPMTLLVCLVGAALALLSAVEATGRRIVLTREELVYHRWFGRRVISLSAVARTVAGYDPFSGAFHATLAVHLWGGRIVDLPLDFLSERDAAALRGAKALKVDWAEEIIEGSAG